ncbi:hypothetical protein [Enterococcus sp. DIV0800]|uniref:hypothetical protein n=1 Tax=unclassified Enterococcus TaxID=2608891 RepID=UPI003D2FCEFD
MNILKCKSFNPTRKYLQLGDLVIDNYSMLKDAELSGSFKTTSHPYSFGHGSYRVQKRPNHFAEEGKMSMTLDIYYKKFSREQRAVFMDFLHYTISRPNKLWAIEGEQVLWTTAVVTDYSKPYQLKKDFVSIDLDLVLYEGIWHIADPRKVFLKPYDSCNFADCLDFRDSQECVDCCINCSTSPVNTCTKCNCECDYLTKEDSLCELRKEVANDFYNHCGDTYQLIYNCEAGGRLWGNNAMLGSKLCKEDSCYSIIAGQFYSPTILETDVVTITLKGVFKDPLIEINGNQMRIKGDYDGILTLTASGEVYYQTSECCEADLLPIEKLIIPKGHTFGFFVHQGKNRVFIETDNCCDMACVFIKTDNFTL